MATISVLIADRREEFQHLVAQWLEHDTRIDIVGYADSGETAIQQAAIRHPDLIVMDMRLSGIDGMTALRKIKKHHNAPRVIVISLYDDPINRAAAQQAGADAFVPKADFAARLLPAVRALFPVADGTT